MLQARGRLHVLARRPRNRPSIRLYFDQLALDVHLDGLGNLEREHALGELRRYGVAIGVSRQGEGAREAAVAAF